MVLATRRRRWVATAALAASLIGWAAAGAQTSQPQARMSRDLVAAACAFDRFMREAGAIDPAFGDGGAVARAVKVGAAYDPQQLETGMIAFAALAALQDARFVAGVREAAEAAGGPEILAHRLIERPDLAIGLPGAEAAAARAAAALATEAEPLLSDGRRIKQAAYDVQHQAWSKGGVVDPAGRLAEAKALSKVSFTPGEDDTRRLYDTVTHRLEASGGGATSPVIAQALALAAEALLGQAGEDHAADLQPILAENRSASCLKMAKLNLFQCLAVAGPHYEDIFCLGEHAMLETGHCVAAAAGATGAAPASHPGDLVVPSASPAPRDIGVPTASAEVVAR